MKNFYKIAMISAALAFTACDDSTSASDNGGNGGNGGSANVACTNEPVECPTIQFENEVYDYRDCNH